MDTVRNAKGKKYRLSLKFYGNHVVLRLGFEMIFMLLKGNVKATGCKLFAGV